MLHDLRQLGLKPGDLIMVHASLRKIGLAHTAFGEGGAELLVDLIDEALGPDGTWMMTLGSQYEMDWVNQHPPERRAGLLANSIPLDPAQAPAMADAGWLAETVRRRPGTKLSANPSGRFGARGAGAEALLADQPWDDYYGPGSPLEKFVEGGGKVLRLGANPDTVTVLHYAEYLADVPNKRRTRWDYLLARPAGPEHVWIECLDDSEGIVDWPEEDYFAAILKAYLRSGRHQETMVGQAKSELIDAGDLVRFGTDWMEGRFRGLSEDGPN